MKIAVCGKGGSGKSTITTLLARELARIGKKVLVIDSDESNYGLHRQIGMELPRDFTEYFGGKDKAFKTMMTSGILEQMKLSAFAKKFFSENFTFTDIPAEYCEKKDGVMLMSSGKIHTANEGCACTMGSVISQFVEHLVLSENEYVLMDMEAGVEHFGRGIDNGMDLILMIVEPSYESLTMTGKIKELADSIQKPVVFALNKVDDENLSIMRAGICEGGEVICELPSNSIVRKAGLTGKELKMDAEPIRKMAEHILKMSL